MKKLDIFLGFVFEGAFKLGFLKERVGDYENFSYGMFEKIKESAGEDEKGFGVQKPVLYFIPMKGDRKTSLIGLVGVIVMRYNS
ncbi:MAG: hypothetical protein ACK4OF_03770 [Aquificaceae bacterium]